MTKYYETLQGFITNQMRMSHIYQPVMLMKLFKNKGSADVSTIAKALLRHDKSPQIMHIYAQHFYLTTNGNL